MALAKLGIIPSVVLILLTWVVVYYTSLITVELNLQANQSLSLGALGKYFSGIISETIGTLNLKLLLYSVLAVYIYGGASILQKLLNTNQSLINIESWYAIIAGLLLLLPIKFLDYINRILYRVNFNISGINFKFNLFNYLG
ncbi:MAG: aromatic amino acid transport family protein [Candidatus Rickettsia vulgarisii]